MLGSTATPSSCSIHSPFSISLLSDFEHIWRLLAAFCRFLRSDHAVTLRAGGLWEVAPGDTGFMNIDGCVTIVDRKKDMILVSGFNVSPNEIESVVAAHPGVAECAAIGVPDEKNSKAVYPRRIFFRDVLPKNPVGKIIRRELRDETPEDFYTKI